MAKQRKRNKKLRKLIAICLICAIILTVSTYAWFIGMKTVNVSSFDVEIATTEGLFLSMDGVDWKYNLDAKNTQAYAKNTNTWADDGLIPMSSIGDMDEDASRMKLFEKASLTTTKGGYRLLASRVANNSKTDSDHIGYIEGKGYVAFDLFIKNMSGNEYYETNEPLNEENIYLTTNSAVTVASTGVANTGIENSVRVAIVQIGRVKGDTTDATTITGITCEDVEATQSTPKITGICRNAQIWEPNDKAHVQNAINWYDTSCLPRNSGGSDVTNAASYNTADGAACATVENGEAYPTYAVAKVLGINDNVDVYDGESYNGYTTDTVDYAAYAAAQDQSGYKLVSYPYFTDTMKNLTGTSRPAFMSLAPNSITKLRVYIFIEGQDIDNYDFASLGKKISVNFGFTKERFTESDVNYSGPSTDITPNAEAEAAAANNSANNGD